MPPPRAILLDLDGTLTDRPASLTEFARSLHHHFAPLLPPHLPDLANLLIRADHAGHRPRAAFVEDFRRTLPWKRVPSATTLRSHWNHHFPRCTVPTPHLHETLATLRARNIQLALVTNGTSLAQRQKIDALGLAPHLSAILISAEVRLKKPDPRIFILATQTLGVPPAETWHIGDHPDHDIQAARRAGLTAVWIRAGRTWPGRADEPKLQVDSFADLPNLISRMAPTGGAPIA